MLVRPTCEPIDLPPGRIARIEFVQATTIGPAVSRFLHFHDVVELVLFGDARGHFICDGVHHDVVPGSVFYAPSMRYHDYIADDGRADWALIQIDPYVVQKVAARLGTAAPIKALCLMPDPATGARLLSLALWLNDAVRCSDEAVLAEHIVALMLAAIWRLPRGESTPARLMTTDIERFTPVVDRLHSRPGDTFSLDEAATLTNLSPAYFSRRFQAVFGCGFADYVMSYRMHLAAQQVASTSSPLSSIAYALGFSSPSHFSARYRDKFGMSPRDYRSAALRSR